MNRRKVLEGGVALLGALGGACTPSGPSAGRIAVPENLPDVDEEGVSSALVEVAELNGEATPGLANAHEQSRGELFTDPFDGATWQSPPLSDELTALVRDQRYWAVEEAQRPTPVWPENARAPDYRHLVEYGEPSEQAFELKAETLAFLAERNAFVFTDQRPVRLFGLRGAMLEADAEEAGWALSHRIKLAKPDHIACQCLLGVWRPEDNQIALFRASTTPAVSNVFKSLQTRGSGASLLPTGLYRYRAGPHKRAYPDRIQRGALLIEGQYAVLRTPDDLSFDPYQPNDIWTRGAAHNIHSAGVWSRPQVYDSAGCQVVRGRYNADRTLAQGPWATFRECAGLVDAEGAPIEEEAAGSGTYQYMLLTGLEAALHAQANAAFVETYRRLRPGSRGEAVEREKARLKEAFAEAPISSSDRFDLWTTFAVLMDQRFSIGEYAAPIVRV